MKALDALLVSLLAVGIVAGESARADEAGGAKGPPVAMTAGELGWQPVPNLTGLKVARVWGAPDAAQGRFVRFEEAKTLPLHKHSASVRVVVVSGTYVYGREGEAEKRYPPGSFVLTPAGTPHVAGCSETCVYFEEVDGKPDFVPVAAGK